MVALAFPSKMDTKPPQSNGVTIKTFNQTQVQVASQGELDSVPEPDQSDTSAISSSNDERKQESQRQAWFENVIKKALKIPNSYVDVAPLIIRWDPEVDDYSEGHTDEVSNRQ